jgi:hypothetical protein
LENKMLINEVMERVHTLEADHGPTGWPAVQMRDLGHHRRHDIRGI